MVEEIGRAGATWRDLDPLVEWRFSASAWHATITQGSGRPSLACLTPTQLRRRHVPALRKLAPYALAIVELEAGPRMTARLVACDPEAVRVGMPVVAAFEDVEGTTLVHFRPA
jgi:hypothetical protein